MQSTINVIRAIGAEYARRILQPIIIIGGIVTILLLAIGGWLTTLSAWWWLLEAIFILAAIIFMILATILTLIIRAVAPTLTKSQKVSVGNFVGRLEHVAEHLQTPHFFLIFYVIRDTLKPRHNGFIESVSMDSKSLAPDFLKLRKEFE